jgi:hypothetical protein
MMKSVAMIVPGSMWIASDYFQEPGKLADAVIQYLEEK